MKYRTNKRTGDKISAIGMGTAYVVEAEHIEAVLLSDDDNWAGINQILSNRLVEHFFREHELEVKTPLTTINVKYGENIKTLPPRPFSSTDRRV